MEQLVILLVVGVIAFAKWVIENALKGKDDDGSIDPVPPLPRPRRPVSEPQSEEERMRKFMEALGIPAGSAPPRPVEPRRLKKEPFAEKVPPPLVPPIPKPVRQPEPTFEVESERPAQPILEKKPVEVPSIRTAAGSEVVAVPAAPVLVEARNSPDFKTADLLQMLRSPGNVRSAVVLREILGPPRGLQSNF